MLELTEESRFVGYYSIGDDALTITLLKKPWFVHRFFMRLCLGWVWHDGLPTYGKLVQFSYTS